MRNAPLHRNPLGLAVIAAYGLGLVFIIASCSKAHAETLNLQTFNRAENARYPLDNRPLDWAQEGHPAYDCKGFTVLKARDAHRQGVSYDRMKALIVAEPSGTHEVLQVDDVVLDNTTNWLQKHADYRVLSEVGAERLVKISALAP